MRHVKNALACLLVLSGTMAAGAEAELSGYQPTLMEPKPYTEVGGTSPSWASKELAYNNSYNNDDNYGNDNYGNDNYGTASSVLGSKHKAYGYKPHWKRMGLTPMVGGSMYSGAWGDHVGNSYTFGLALDIPVSPYFSAELEGGYARYNVSYSYNPAYIYKHDFDQFLIGGNGKVYLMRGTFRPYLGGGITGLYYTGLTKGPYYPVRYNQWVGAGQLLAGAEVELTHDIAIGGRGAWLIPMFNRPHTVDNGIMSAPGYEEAAMVNTSFYKLMATLTVTL